MKTTALIVDDEAMSRDTLGALLNERHPAIEVSHNVAGRQSILERLKANADYLYLLTSPPDIPPVVAHPIFPNPLVAVAAADLLVNQGIDLELRFGLND